ncbi:hypothetical protein V5785_22460, partial [Bacillus subtilis]
MSLLCRQRWDIEIKRALRAGRPPSAKPPSHESRREIVLASKGGGSIELGTSPWVLLQTQQSFSDWQQFYKQSQQDKDRYQELVAPKGLGTGNRFRSGKIEMNKFSNQDNDQANPVLSNRLIVRTTRALCACTFLMSSLFVMTIHDSRADIVGNAGGVGQSSNTTWGGRGGRGNGGGGMGGEYVSGGSDISHYYDEPPIAVDGKGADGTVFGGGSLG